MRKVVVLLVMLVSGCGTKKNPDACCVDAADCAAVGLPVGSECEDGRSCRNNRCVELSCSTSDECDALEPYCGGDICEATCSDDAQCPGFGQMTSQKFCEGSCVECRTAADCGTATPVCAAGACRKCIANDECASGACTADGSCAEELAVAYVAPDGSPASGCTRGMPCSFTRAIDPGINRRYVVLGAGNYQLTATVTLEGLRNFIGVKGTRPTITKTVAGVILQLGSGADITFDNVEIRGATNSTPTAVDGIGIDCPSNFQKSTLRITRSLFSQNQSGGVFARQCNLQVSESTFVNNQRGLEATDVMGTIERSTFANNLATGLVLDGGLYNVVNNFIYRNQRGSDIYVAISGSTFAFNTVADNSMVGVACEGSGDFTFPTNLITGNGTNVTTSPDCSFSGSMILAGDTSAVKYKSPTTMPYDYHLMPGSTAIDQISNSTQVRDFDGETRPYGNGHDFGADELH